MQEQGRARAEVAGRERKEGMMERGGVWAEEVEMLDAENRRRPRTSKAEA